METKWIPVKNQKFEIGRTMNPLKCLECKKNKECDFMNCKNYAVKMEVGKYTIDEWIEYNKTEIKRGWTDELVAELFDSLMSKFPKGLYWQTVKNNWNDKVKSIDFVKMGKHDLPIVLASINLKSMNFTNFDLPDIKEKFAIKVAKTIKAINDKVSKSIL